MGSEQNFLEVWIRADQMVVLNFDLTPFSPWLFERTYRSLREPLNKLSASKNAVY